MSGNIRGKIECKHVIVAAPPYRIINELFKNLYDFFVAHPNYTLVARHGGTGSAAGDIGYWDDGNPFRTKAWFVVKNAATISRPFDYYLLIQHCTYNEDVNFGVSAPCVIRAIDYDMTNARIAISAAIGVGGDANPWNGGGALGESTKGTPVWKVPAGGTQRLVLPRTNNPGGAYDTNKQDASAIWQLTASSNETRTSRSGVVADDDSVFIFFSPADDLAYYVFALTAFTPRPGLTLSYPIVELVNWGAATRGILPGQTYGGISGSEYYDGGVPHRDFAIAAVRDVYVDMFGAAGGAAHQPNLVFAAPEYDLFPLLLMMNEAPYYGIIGQVELMRLGYNIPSTDTSTDLKTIFLGSSTQADAKNAIPWDGATTPRTGITRAGVTFSRVP